MNRQSVAYRRNYGVCRNVCHNYRRYCTHYELGDCPMVDEPYLVKPDPLEVEAVFKPTRWRRALAWLDRHSVAFSALLGIRDRPLGVRQALDVLMGYCRRREALAVDDR